MPKRIALVAIGVTRKGITVYPPVGTDKDGEPFDFTAEEITELEALQKANDMPMLRKLRNEGNEESTPALSGTVTPAASLSKPDAPAAPAPSGEKTFTVENSAAELKAEAESRGLDYSGLKTKAQLVELLATNPAKSEAPAVEDEDL